MAKGNSTNGHTPINKTYTSTKDQVMKVITLNNTASYFVDMIIYLFPVLLRCNIFIVSNIHLAEYIPETIHLIIT